MSTNNKLHKISRQMGTAPEGLADLNDFWGSQGFFFEVSAEPADFAWVRPRCEPRHYGTFHRRAGNLA